MMPLCTSATRPCRPGCGWALTSLGAPWVAHRVCPMPVVDAGSGVARAPSRGWRACPPACVEPRRPLSPAVDQRDPRGVVAAVLQATQPLDHDVLRLAWTDVTDDSAHGPNSSEAATPAWPPRGAGAGCNNRVPCRQAWAPPARTRGRETSPYIELRPRCLGRAGPPTTETPLSEEEIGRLRGLRRLPGPAGGRGGLPPDLAVAQPVRRVGGPLHRQQEDFLHRRTPPRTPFVIGLAGSVAVGKSTTARVLQEMLAHWPEHPNVALVTTDGFLYPNAELERRGHPAPQGLPGLLRPPGAAALRRRHQVGQGRGRGTDVLPPRLRRGARREGRHQPARHRDHRGTQRAAAGPGARGRP